MFFQAFPRSTSVIGAVETAARAAAGQSPGLAAGFPERSKKNVGIVRIERDIDAASILVSVENLPPTLAAVHGAKNASFRIWAEGVAEGGDISDIRISGMNDDATNGA